MDKASIVRAFHNRNSIMNQVEIALANPVFDPETQIIPQCFWMAERLISAGLTVNIGME